MTRPSMHTTLMAMAQVLAQRSTCSRLAVGALITKDTRIIASGYNGAPAGMPHCTHPDNQPCRISVHAEINAIAFAARNGASTLGADLYCTAQPCYECAKAVINAGIARVYYRDTYRNHGGLHLLDRAGITPTAL